MQCAPNRWGYTMENVSGYLLLKRRSIILAAADIANARAQRLITENRIARLRREAAPIGWAYAETDCPDHGREF